MRRWIIIAGIVLVVLSIIIGLVMRQQSNELKRKLKKVTTYETCEKTEGSMIQESYPPTCVTADKRTFIQNIGNELEFTDTILIDNPRPNQKVTNPFMIKGKARGTWFFEANFPIELFDDKGNPLGTAVATAEGEWMTEEFVPFTAELKFDKPKTEKGLLLIKNANPSGLPENEKELLMPIKF